MGTGAGATVYADGARVADGAPADDPTAPTALAGLKIVWGRASTVDQPEASTCSFDLVDSPGGPSFGEHFRTGTRVEVTATATTYPDPAVSTFLDPGFETAGPVADASVRVVPSRLARPASAVVATNLMPNPSFEVDTAGVTAVGTGVTLASSTTWAQSGTRSLQVNIVDTPNAGFTCTVMAAAPGETYTVTCWVHAPAAAGRTADFRLRARVPTVTIVASQVVTFGATPTKVQLTATMPAGTTGVDFSAFRGSVGTYTYFVDAILFERAATPSAAYFDGSTPPADGFTYSWTGAAHASTSQKRTAVTPGGTGAWVARLHATEPGRAWSTVLAPAPFAAPGADADAWDAIPATAPGQRWSYGAWLRVPAGVTVTLAPVVFTGPWAGWSTPVPGATATVAGTGAWVQVAGTALPDVAGAWVGLAVSAYPTTGPTWNTAAGTWNTAVGSWDDLADVLVDDIAVLAPATGTPATVLAFAGRVTSLTAAYDDVAGAPMLRVTASDFIADLDNRTVGDTPWVVESMSARMARILALTGQDVDAVIDAGVGATLVSWRDVDAQPAASLLRELASSVDAVLWSATHRTTGPYLLVEDTRTRPAGAELVDVAGAPAIAPNLAGLTQLSACEVERAPVTWSQDVANVATRAEVSWLQQGVGGDGLPTTTVLVERAVDPAAEALAGVRAVTLTSQLQSAADAQAVAVRLKARTAGGWVSDGLTLDDDDVAGTDADIARALALLDGTRRNGLGLALVDLPAWAPGAPALGVYVEGGTYTYTGGRWVLDLTVSNSASQGQSVTWNELSAGWTWNEFGAITWDDLFGVAG